MAEEKSLFDTVISVLKETQVFWEIKGGVMKAQLT